MIITIDGPSGTGKSTVAKGVAKRLNFTFFDTGAMYRCFTWFVLEKGVDPQDVTGVEALLPSFHFETRNLSKQKRRYFVNQKDVTDEIRSQQVSKAASQIAVLAKVRKAMVKIQREFGDSVDAVFEGRDIGTVVFPEADLKIFLTARAEVRAERRWQELIHKFPDISISRDQILKEIQERDKVDSSRAISPLKRAKDGILIDTSEMSALQVIKKIVQMKPTRSFVKMKLSYRWVYLVTRFFFKLFYRLQIFGLEHFPNGPAIIAANHTSFYDPPAVSVSCPEEVHFLARKSLFKIPFFGFLIRMLNAHPVSKGASDAVVFRLMLDLLSKGKKLIFFPEGSRSCDGNILPLEKGLAFLAFKAKCPIIPTYIHGTFDVWPRKRKFPRLFGKVSVVFGKPILFDEINDKKTAMLHITKKTDQAIRKLKEWLEKKV